MTNRLIPAIIALVLVCSLLLYYVPGSCQQGITETPTATIEGAVLNLYGTDPYTLDPALASDATSNEYVLQIFSGLVCLDENLKPAPDIAEDWQVSDDGLVYTFELRQDAFFHDGKQVTAYDFEYSWERACNPATGSQTAAIYLGDIIGVDEVLAGESEYISGIEVINDYKLQVTLEEPCSYFLYKLTYVTSFVVDEENVAEGSWWWYQPNGTGPFRLWRWNEGTQLVLKRNDYYDITSSFKGVDFIVYSLWSGVAMNMYEMGEIDIAGVGITYIDKVTDEAGDFYQDLSVVSELSLTYIGFNCSEAPFDDPNIRRAFAMAIDKEKLVSLTLKDTVTKADGILPLDMPGYNEDLAGIKFDVEGALALVAASEYGDVANLPTITITTGGWGGLVSSDLESIINEWRVNLGVEVEVRQLEPEQFLYDLMEEKDQMFYWGWIADYPHPQDFLEVLFGSGSEHNIGEYSKPEVDALLETAGAELDSESSLALYQQVEQMLIDDAACIPLWFGKNYVLTKPYISGYSLNPLGIASLSEVSIAE